MDRFDAAENFFNKYILDELFENKITCWIAGGIIRDYFSGIPIKTDCDLFFPNKNHYNKALEYFKNEEAEEIYSGEYGSKIKYKGKIFDVINKFFDNPLATIEAFDFTVCQFAVFKNNRNTTQLLYGDNTFVDLAKRQLMFSSIPYPASSLKRIIKYTKKGFKICNEELKKIVIAINEMEIEKPNITNTENTENTENEEISGNNFFSGID